MQQSLLLALHDEVFEALIADFLVFCNYKVQAAYSQKDALTCCQNSEFEVAVIDIEDETDIRFLEYLLTLQPELNVLALVRKSVSPDIKTRIPLPEEQILSLPAPLVSILEAIKVTIELRQNAKLQSMSPITIGSLCIDKQNGRILIHNSELTLTGTEFSLLELLIDHLNEPVSKDDIYPKVLGRPKGQYDRAIDVHISSIRHKLQQSGCNDLCIESVRGVGYQLRRLDHREIP